LLDSRARACPRICPRGNTVRGCPISARSLMLRRQPRRRSLRRCRRWTRLLVSIGTSRSPSSALLPRRHHGPGLGGLPAHRAGRPSRARVPAVAARPAPASAAHRPATICGAVAGHCPDGARPTTRRRPPKGAALFGCLERAEDRRADGPPRWRVGWAHCSPGLSGVGFRTRAPVCGTPAETGVHVATVGCQSDPDQILEAV
jgi:hypothetical protein